jgi:aspartate 1-decarboxylase
MIYPNFYRAKRSCIHNVRVDKSNVISNADIPDGLVIPREIMRVADIAPFEQINVTKIGGSNWMNRMYTFAIPGDGDQVEARGSIAHLLSEGELCCIITATNLDSDQHQMHVNGTFTPPIIDVRLYPNDKSNDMSDIKIVLERQGRFDRVKDLTDDVVDERAALPRVMLSNLLAGLTIETVEKRGCIEMSAELPIEYMQKAGFCNAQSIVVYNSSRGGASAESYVVPSLTKKTIGISGALTAVADVGDRISQAAYVTTSNPHFQPTIHNVLK